MGLVRIIIGMPAFLIGWAIGLYFGAVEFCAGLTLFGVRWVDRISEPMPSWWTDFIVPRADWGFFSSAAWLAGPTTFGVAITALVCMAPFLLAAAALGVLGD